MPKGHEKRKAEAQRQRQEEALRQQRKAEQEERLKAKQEAARQAAATAKARRKASQDAARKARTERRRKIIEEVLAKKPLRPGRYMFVNAFPRGVIDGLRFTLTELDLNDDKLLVHLNVENLGNDPRFEQQGHERGHIRIGLTRADGSTLGYAAIRVKEGALAENNGSISFPPTGKSGAFVIEFQRDALQSTFSLVVNDQPLVSGINLRKAMFLSF